MPGEDVAAEHVGAEQRMSGSNGRWKGAPAISHGLVGNTNGAEQRHREDHRQDDQADDRALVAAEAFPEVACALMRSAASSMRGSTSE